jgi:hypothetical protein
MTFEKLQKMTLEEILRYIKGIEHQNLRYRYNMKARRERKRRVELATQVEVAQGNIIPLYYEDEFTGIRYRAERPSQFVLLNSPKGDGAA